MKNSKKEFELSYNSKEEFQMKLNWDDCGDCLLEGREVILCKSVCVRNRNYLLSRILKNPKDVNLIRHSYCPTD